MSAAVPMETDAETATLRRQLADLAADRDRWRLKKLADVNDILTEGDER